MMNKYNTLYHMDWSGLSFPPLGDPSNPGIKLGSPKLPGGFLPSKPPGKPQQISAC